MEAPAIEAYDVIIIGAGAAGLMCAIHAGKRGRRVLVLDHSAKIGGKILISGGGRCNFTNTGTQASHFVSANEHFSKSALSRYSPEDFIEMVHAHKIPFHEKKLGQLFCDDSARDILRMLQAECDKVFVQFKLSVEVRSIKKDAELFRVDLGAKVLQSKSLVIATGGLSLPKIGASPLGYTIAKEFGLKIVPTFPALDGFIFDPSSKDIPALKDLAGISVDCELSCNGLKFRENILFTHKGLSGPAALQGSLHWNKGDEISINLVPDQNVLSFFLEKKKTKSLALVKTLLSTFLATRFAEAFSNIYFGEAKNTPLSQVPDKTLQLWAEQLQNWKLFPSDTVGYSKAEVTKGGVDTEELSSKTMESKKVSGLFFIGEVVDVTGWLGGYNFQWAWASGWAAAQAIKGA